MMGRKYTQSAIAWIALATAATSMADDWPQWRGPDRDGVWRESGLVEKFDSQTIKPVWQVPIGNGYSGPTVADGRVFVTDRVLKPTQKERVHCFDARNGKSLWSYEYDCPYRGVDYDAGPRASVSINEGHAYALGAMGHLHCFEDSSGTVVWKRDLLKDFDIQMPIWGVSASPLIDGDLIIAQIGGSPDACLVALDKKTGKTKWTTLSDTASYAAPIMIEQSGQRVLVCYTGERVVGLNPADGKLLWSHPFPPVRMVIGVATPVVYKDHLFITDFFNGSLLLKLHQDQPRVSEVWQRRGENEKDTDALHSIIATPIVDADYIYGVDSYGELRCLKLSTGDRVWENLSLMPKARWATAHLTPNGKRTWIFTERGELVIAELSPKGLTEIDRAKLIEPTLPQLRRRGGVCWSHPAYADRHIFVRNDEALVCANLGK